MPEDRWWADVMPDVQTEDDLSRLLLGFTCDELIYGKGPNAVPLDQRLKLEPKPSTAPVPTAPPVAPAARPPAPLPIKVWATDEGVKRFREVILAFGAPEHGTWSLFPVDDPVLQSARGSRAPYFKHTLHKASSGGFEFKPTSLGWTVGEKAARAGLEYRAFFDPLAPQSRSTHGAVRFSEGARADAGSFDDYVHGGAIQTLLDEVTAECAMIHVCVLPTTVEASFKILKKVGPA